MAAVPPPLGARPHPNQNDMSASGSVISQRFVCSLARCEDNKCASKAHEAARKARKDRSERARCVSVEGPDEPHSRSARNEETGLSFRGERQGRVLALSCAVFAVSHYLRFA